jgi:K+-transporting ATPase ATPase B chain
MTTAQIPAVAERRAISLFRPDIVRRAVIDSLIKLDPRVQVRNPVMFVVEIGAAITTVTWLIQVFGGGPLGGGNDPAWYTLTISIWLWLTVVFANIAEAFAEGRGRAQADTLRAMRTETVATMRDGSTKAASELVRGDVVVVDAGELIPGDGTVIEGVATVDESAITGESAPVIRESGGDRSAVTGGTRVTSDRLVIEVTQEPGHSFLDRMIALVEGAERRKTPNEIALGILLAALTLVFVIVVAALRPFGLFAHTPISETTLISLLVALIPTTIGALLSAIGIAGMDRLVRRNVLALSGRAVEASGRCRRAAARQDGHDHARQPAGVGVHPNARDRRDRAGERRATGLARRRDAGGPLDRRAGQDLRNPRARHGPAASQVRAVHRADTDERRQPRRPPTAQGRRRRDHRLRRRPGRSSPT